MSRQISEVSQILGLPDYVVTPQMALAQDIEQSFVLGELDEDSFFRDYLPITDARKIRALQAMEDSGADIEEISALSDGFISVTPIWEGDNLFMGKISGDKIDVPFENIFGYIPESGVLIYTNMEGLSLKSRENTRFIGLPIPERYGKVLADSVGELPEGSKRTPVSEMHITLALTTKKQSGNAIIKAVTSVLKQWSSIEGKTDGLITFSGNEEDGIPVCAHFDSPMIGKFREHVIRALSENGVRALMTHGFTPHITLAYLPKGSTVPEISVPSLTLRLDQVMVDDQRLVMKPKNGSVATKGGQGSGNWGHGGLPGVWGGSGPTVNAPSGGGASSTTTLAVSDRVRSVEADFENASDEMNFLIRERDNPEAEVAFCKIDPANEYGQIRGWITPSGDFYGVNEKMPWVSHRDIVEKIDNGLSQKELIGLGFIRCQADLRDMTNYTSDYIEMCLPATSRALSVAEGIVSRLPDDRWVACEFWNKAIAKREVSDNRTMALWYLQRNSIETRAPEVLAFKGGRGSGNWGHGGLVGVHGGSSPTKGSGYIETAKKMPWEMSRDEFYNTPIYPEPDKGHQLIFHVTKSNEALDSIQENGLLVSKGQSEEGGALWGTDKPWNNRPLVVFQVPEKDVGKEWSGKPIVKHGDQYVIGRDIKPKDILGIYPYSSEFAKRTDTLRSWQTRPRAEDWWASFVKVALEDKLGVPDSVKAEYEEWLGKTTKGGKGSGNWGHGGLVGVWGGSSPTKTSGSRANNFKKWFGNSKVVDENGEPKIVYHGTDADFQIFDPDYGWFSEETFELQPGRYISAIFFTANPKMAGWYAGARGETDINVIPAYLKMENPLIADIWEQDTGAVTGALQDAVGMERDGLIMRYFIHGEDHTAYAVFSPEQIKSPFNAGDFDPKNPSILKEVSTKGGQGSGNWGHGGLSSVHGGSSPSNKTPETSADHTLYNFVEAVGTHFKHTKEAYLLKRGVFFKAPTEPCPYEGEKKMCYINATHLALDYPEYTYIEGYAVSHLIDMAVEHAWVVDTDGNVIDSTWENKGVAYFGVEIPDQALREALLETGVYGILNYLASKNTDLTTYKGGQGSGNWGHSGLAGVHGGSSSPTKQIKKFAKPSDFEYGEAINDLAYHGTVSRILNDYGDDYIGALRRVSFVTSSGRTISGYPHSSIIANALIDAGAPEKISYRMGHALDLSGCIRLIHPLTGAGGLQIPEKGITEQQIRTTTKIIKELGDDVRRVNYEITSRGDKYMEGGEGLQELFESFEWLQTHKGGQGSGNWGHGGLAGVHGGSSPTKNVGEIPDIPDDILSQAHRIRFDTRNTLDQDLAWRFGDSKKPAIADTLPASFVEARCVVTPDGRVVYSEHDIPFRSTHTQMYAYLGASDFEKDLSNYQLTKTRDALVNMLPENEMVEGYFFEKGYISITFTDRDLSGKSITKRNVHVKMDFINKRDTLKALKRLTNLGFERGAKHGMGRLSVDFYNRDGGFSLDSFYDLDNLKGLRSFGNIESGNASSITLAPILDDMGIGDFKSRMKEIVDRKLTQFAVEKGGRGSGNWGHGGLAGVHGGSSPTKDASQSKNADKIERAFREMSNESGTGVRLIDPSNTDFSNYNKVSGWISPNGILYGETGDRDLAHDRIARNALRRSETDIKSYSHRRFMDMGYARLGANSETIFFVDMKLPATKETMATVRKIFKQMIFDSSVMYIASFFNEGEYKTARSYGEIDFYLKRNSLERVAPEILAFREVSEKGGKGSGNWGHGGLAGVHGGSSPTKGVADYKGIKITGYRPVESLENKAPKQEHVRMVEGWLDELPFGASSVPIKEIVIVDKGVDAKDMTRHQASVRSVTELFYGENMSRAQGAYDATHQIAYIISEKANSPKFGEISHYGFRRVIGYAMSYTQKNLLGSVITGDSEIVKLWMGKFNKESDAVYAWVPGMGKWGRGTGTGNDQRDSFSKFFANYLAFRAGEEGTVGSDPFMAEEDFAVRDMDMWLSAYTTKARVKEMLTKGNSQENIRFKGYIRAIVTEKLIEWQEKGGRGSGNWGHGGLVGVHGGSTPTKNVSRFTARELGQEDARIALNDLPQTLIDLGLGDFSDTFPYRDAKGNYDSDAEWDFINNVEEAYGDDGEMTYAISYMLHALDEISNPIDPDLAFDGVAVYNKDEKLVSVINYRRQRISMRPDKWVIHVNYLASLERNASFRCLKKLFGIAQREGFGIEARSAHAGRFTKALAQRFGVQVNRELIDISMDKTGWASWGNVYIPAESISSVLKALGRWSKVVTKGGQGSGNWGHGGLAGVHGGSSPKGFGSTITESNAYWEDSRAENVRRRFIRRAGAQRGFNKMRAELNGCRREIFERATTPPYDIDEDLKKEYEKKMGVLSLKAEADFDKLVDMIGTDDPLNATVDIWGVVRGAPHDMQGFMKDHYKKQYNKTLSRFLGIVPSDQIDSSKVNLSIEMMLDLGFGEGAIYIPQKDKIVINPTANIPRSTIVHEFAHWLEHHQPKIMKKALAFRDRRTKGEKTIHLPAYGADFKVDRFVTPYAGKLYRSNIATEIFSVGVQYLFDDPVGFAKIDPDYFNFTIDAILGD